MNELHKLIQKIPLEKRALVLEHLKHDFKNVLNDDEIYSLENVIDLESKVETPFLEMFEPKVEPNHSYNETLGNLFYEIQDVKYGKSLKKALIQKIINRKKRRLSFFNYKNISFELKKMFEKRVLMFISISFCWFTIIHLLLYGNKNFLMFVLIPWGLISLICLSSFIKESLKELEESNMDGHLIKDGNMSNSFLYLSDSFEIDNYILNELPYQPNLIILNEEDKRNWVLEMWENPNAKIYLQHKIEKNEKLTVDDYLFLEQLKKENCL